jgi:hypothetical protein
MQPAVAAAGAPSRPPVRMCFWYVPNGVHLPAWFPEHEGVLIDLPETLRPLSFARDYLNCFRGLTHNTAMTNGDEDGCGHGQGAASFLTGAQAFRSQDNVRVGMSIDQLYAHHETHISWRTPTSPAPYEINPKLVFDRLFTDGGSKLTQATVAERDFYRKSILDFVREDAGRIQKHVSGADRQKLTAHPERGHVGRSFGHRFFQARGHSRGL